MVGARIGANCGTQTVYCRFFACDVVGVLVQVPLFIPHRPPGELDERWQLNPLVVLRMKKDILKSF